MLILLHGENTVASRLFLDRYRKFQDVQIIEGKSLNASILRDVLQPSLLSTEKTVILENPSESDLSPLEDISGVNLVVWLAKKLENPTLRSPPWKIKEFALFKSQNLYRFIDAFMGRNLKGALASFCELQIEKVPYELIVGSLNRQISLFLTFDKVSLNRFQKEKIAIQSKAWKKENLLELLKSLLKTESLVKSGKIEAEIGLLNFILLAFT